MSCIKKETNVKHMYDMHNSKKNIRMWCIVKRQWYEMHAWTVNARDKYTCGYNQRSMIMLWMHENIYLTTVYGMYVIWA